MLRAQIASAAKLLAALTILQIGLLTLAPPATSHVNVETDPASGSRLEKAPSQIHLRFSQPVHPAKVEVTLRAADGPKQTLQLDKHDGDRPRLEYTASPAHHLRRASYTIEVTASADGHFMQYRSYFVVGPGPVVKQNANSSETSPASDTLNRTGSPLGLIALVGIGILFTATLTGAPRSMLAVAAKTAKFSAWFGLTAIMLHLAAVVLAHDTGLSAVYGTQVGRLLLLQLLTLGLVLWTAERLIAVPEMSQRRVNWENALAVGGLVLILTYAARSHAAGDEWSFMSLMVATVHLGSVSLWLSGLVAMAIAASRDKLDAAPAVVLSRFSKLARRCASLAVASGIFLAFHLTDGFDTAALASTFGAALIGKATMVAVLCFCAWRTHRALDAARETLTPLPPSQEKTATATAAQTLVLSPAKAPAQNSQLRRRILTETRAALVVLIAANILAAWAH